MHAIPFVHLKYVLGVIPIELFVKIYLCSVSVKVNVYYVDVKV